MKHYLNLVPISNKIHKKRNRMSIICIILSVLLVTAIFGMADMFIRSQLVQAYKIDGNWHVSFKNISEEDAALIKARPDVKVMSWYEVINYRAELNYSLGGKPVAICGFDEEFIRDIYADISLIEGNFPTGGQEAVLTQSAKEELGLKIGDTITIEILNAQPLTLTVSGFADNTAMLMKYDCYGVFLSTEQFQPLYQAYVDTSELHPGMYYVQFSGRRNIQNAIKEIQNQFNLADNQVVQNIKVLGLLGQSREPMMLYLYGTATVLFFLVLFSGILMIASSLNNNVVQKTQFFGMLRCIGATPKQITRIVRAEALMWCKTAIPIGIGVGIILIWVLCAMLRWLSPYYFAEMPVLAVSIPSILAGIIVGLLTVYFAARSPAKRAASVSPLTAVTGNADAPYTIKNAANTRRLRIDTALGIHHAKFSKKNLVLMVGSFSFSIILFLSFSCLISFMNHALTPLNASTPDVSIVSADNTRSIKQNSLGSLQSNPVVDRLYGRMFAFDIPISLDGLEGTVDLISFEKHQFQWAKSDLIEGSITPAEQENDAVLTVFHPRNPFKFGDVVTLNCNGQLKTLRIAGVLSDSPFDSGNGFGNIICSENTFQQLMGAGGYTIVDIQLKNNATDADVQAIRSLFQENTMFSDRRASNKEVTGAYLAFSLFVYGFLILIALITVVHIVNSLSMSVAARMKQYGVMRAIGMSGKQLIRMVTAEAITYTIAGSLVGCLIGLPIHKFLFEKMVTYRWGDLWQPPVDILCIIIFVVIITAFLAVRGPARRIREMSIIDTIHAH